jgi:hypothetical protein
MTDIKIKHSHNFVNITGNRYGRLVVISYAGKVKLNPYWNCRCECGNEKKVLAISLKNGDSKSCGCLQRELISKMASSHRMARTPEYTTWALIKQRCLNKNASNYKNYGGRGITICERWLESFENFIADMGKKPSPKHSIDRVDNELGYFKENCRWATIAQQSINKRNTVIINKSTLAELAEKYNIKYKTLHLRFAKGWTFDEATLTPVRGHQP